MRMRSSTRKVRHPPANPRVGAADRRDRGDRRFLLDCVRRPHLRYLAIVRCSSCSISDDQTNGDARRHNLRGARTGSCASIRSTSGPAVVQHQGSRRLVLLVALALRRLFVALRLVNQSRTGRACARARGPAGREAMGCRSLAELLSFAFGRPCRAHRERCSPRRRRVSSRQFYFVAADHRLPMVILGLGSQRGRRGALISARCRVLRDSGKSRRDLLPPRSSADAVDVAPPRASGSSDSDARSASLCTSPRRDRQVMMPASTRRLRGRHDHWVVAPAHMARWIGLRPTSA